MYIVLMIHFENMALATVVLCLDGQCIKTFGPYGPGRIETFNDADMMFNNITAITVGQSGSLKR